MVIVEPSDAQVAVVAEQFTDYASIMVMVDAEAGIALPPRIVRTADGTSAVLGL